jgi:hypothetical protein
MKVIADTVVAVNKSPLELRAFIIFSILILSLDMSIYYSPSLHKKIVPYTGWFETTGPYLFGIIVALTAILSSRRKQVYGLIAVLSYFAIFGAFDWYRHTLSSESMQPNFNNPYLTYSEWRPLLSVGLPVAWVLILLTKRMRAWIHTQ